MLNAIPDTALEKADLQMGDATDRVAAIFTTNTEPQEAALEAREINKYLLAKSLFDCREFDRCAAVFLPDSLLAGILSGKGSENSSDTPKGKGKLPADDNSKLPKLSQKSLFLALYAKFMSGEKRRDEDSEMVMGPHDLGSISNKQLRVVGRFLSNWFDEQASEGDGATGSQGWLEYLLVPTEQPSAHAILTNK